MLPLEYNTNNLQVYYMDNAGGSYSMVPIEAESTPLITTSNSGSTNNVTTLQLNYAAGAVQGTGQASQAVNSSSQQRAAVASSIMQTT